MHPLTLRRYRPGGLRRVVRHAPVCVPGRSCGRAVCVGWYAIPPTASLAVSMAAMTHGVWPTKPALHAALKQLCSLTQPTGYMEAEVADPAVSGLKHTCLLRMSRAGALGKQDRTITAVSCSADSEGGKKVLAKKSQFHI